MGGLDNSIAQRTQNNPSAAAPTSRPVAEIRFNGAGNKIACLTLEGEKLPPGSPLFAEPRLPGQQLPSVIEDIAQQWDGCAFESSTGNIDIGWAIRAAGKRLMSEQPKEGGE
ncbi:hypothetical protein CFN79_15055 [Chromobacterium vaccinii]|uniref:hypothetical protein n=1 Tax=Chromobacterium vaccinii TaxID=1108595 RepID=UPI000CE99988|nr:hypothetical protein [Chromobacterium vaccinii]AVG17065.1 hypothetical protein CFN79_15055 [Chromobacterium vaccinii]